MRQMLLPKLERGDESDDGGMETSPRFTRGGFSTRIKATGVKDGEIANLKDEDKVRKTNNSNCTIYIFIVFMVGHNQERLQYLAAIKRPSNKSVVDLSPCYKLPPGFEVEPRVEAESWFVIGGFNENFVVMGEWLDGSPKQKKRSSLFTRWS
ncbi:hypothetical protein Bca52824_064084 [Brassica carinata]|uniref:Uncharacterized protein n=1 Tax=Brassica carinata TaxID=52824 RepID=A0A8X7QL73_BRACI|nr:hypothetical protein Bca52824_064084 [Brassica carinata]